MANLDNTETPFNIIIVGAGLSGLTSALKIQQREPSLRVKILESSNRVGGQITSTSLGETGARWITEDQCHAYRLLKYFNIPTPKIQMKMNNLKALSDVNRGIFGSLANYELKRYISELELKMSCYKIEYQRFKRPTMSIHIRKRLFFSNSRKFMMNLVLLISGQEAHDITYNEFMNICYSCGGIRRLINLLVEIPNSMLEFSGNYLLEKILQEISNTEIILQRKILRIEQYRDYVVLFDSNRQYHTCDAVILAIPWNDLIDISFSPPMPLEIQNPPTSADSMKYVVTSFIAKYRESYWRNLGFSGNLYCHEPFLIGYEYPSSTSYAGYVVHEEGIEPLIRTIILHQLSAKFGDHMLIPLDYRQNTFELSIKSHKPLTTPWNRIIWSSSAASATCYRGFLGGAVQSGLRAAMHSLLLLRPQTVTWNDIANIQCHEYLPPKNFSMISVLLSSWNIYDVSIYFTFTTGVILSLCAIYKRSK